MKRKHKVTANGYDWEITIDKRRGNLEVTAYGGKYSTTGDGKHTLWGFAMFQDPAITLLKVPCTRATEKAISEAFNQGVRKFNAMLEAGELPSRFIPVLNGMYRAKGGDMHIVLSNEANTGDTYPSIHLGSGTHSTVHIDGNSEFCGVATAESLADRVRHADQLRDLANQKWEADRAREAQEQQEQKAAMDAVTVPGWAQAAIVAKLKERHPSYDPMTDYFPHPQTARRVLLAWSHKDRNDMQELTAAADSNPDIDVDRTEKYTEGGYNGYFLGGDSPYSTGWIIQKVSIEEGKKAAIEENRAKTDVPYTPAPAAHNQGEMLVNLNAARQGIEVKFANRPDPGVLDTLKRNGFRWSKFQKLWYAKDTERTRAFVRSLGWTGDAAAATGDRDYGGDMLDASMEQAADTWAHNNL